MVSGFFCTSLAYCLLLFRFQVFAMPITCACTWPAALYKLNIKPPPLIRLLVGTWPAYPFTIHALQYTAC